MSWHVLHHNVVVPHELADRMDGNHVFVSYGCGGPRFAREPLSRRTGDGKFRSQHLDGHESVQRRIEPLEHNARPTAPNHSHNFVRADATNHPRIVRRCKNMTELLPQTLVNVDLRFLAIASADFAVRPAMSQTDSGRIPPVS